MSPKPAIVPLASLAVSEAMVDIIKTSGKKMTISITLPNGKDLIFTQGKGGVDKLFTTNVGEVVVVTGATITKFGGCVYVCEFSKKKGTKEIA